MANASGVSAQQLPQPDGIAKLDPATLEPFVDGVVQDALRAEHIAGAAVIVVQGDKVVLSKGYGVASFSPYRPVDVDRTVFRLASISKTFTWLAVLKASEDGRLNLTSPIASALPASLRPKAKGGRSITFADLMAHRSGFEDRELGRLYVDRPDHLRPLETFLAQDRPSQVREAGGLPSYSNYGVALAGAAVARVRGQEFNDLIEDELIKPLGLTSTTFREPYPARPDLPEPMPSKIAARLSEGFHWNGARLVPQHFEYATQMAPAASASGTAADMGRYMRAMLAGGTLNGREIWGPKTAQALLAPLAPAAAGVPAWRHGFRDYRLAGGYAGYGHNGVTMSFLSNLVVVPSLDLGVFIVTNTETGRPLVDRLPDLVVARFYAPAALLPKRPDPGTALKAARYSGAWLTLRRPFGGLGEFAYRLSPFTVSVTKDGVLIARWRGRATNYVRDVSAPPGVERFIEQTGSSTLVFTGTGPRASHIYGPTGAEVFARTPVIGLGPTIYPVGLVLALVAFGTAASAIVRMRQGPKLIALAVLAACLSWLLAVALFLRWANAASDSLVLTFTWPGELPYASFAAWACGLCSVLVVCATPALLKAKFLPARVRFGWPAVALGFLAQIGLLSAWGALTFWRW